MPLSDPPASISGETSVPTLREADAAADPDPPTREGRITAIEKRITMSERERAELEAYRLAKAEGTDKPAFAITQRQLTALITVVLSFVGAMGGGGYFVLDSQVESHVDSQVDDSVADKVIEDTRARDEAHRKVVAEELGKVMIDVNARVERDRAGFSTKIGDIGDNVEALDKRMAAHETATADQMERLKAVDAKLAGIETKQTDDTAKIIEAIKASKSP
jgi:hypothetical protein